MNVSSKPRPSILLYSFICLFLFCVSAAANNDTLVINGTSTQISLLPYAGILFDHDNKLEINDIAQQPKDVFEPLVKTSNSFGFSNAAIWLHFRVKGSEGSPDLMLLSLDAPLLDNISVFIKENGQFQEQRVGDRIPYSTRLIDHRNPVFFIPIHKNKPADYYVRIKSEGSIRVPMTLRSYDNFIVHVDRAQLLFGAYYSLMAILTLASLYAFFLIKEHIFLRYSVYLASFLLFQFSINGFSFQFIWGKFPEVTSELNASMVGIVIMAALWFSGEFLQIRKNSLRTYHLFRGLYWVSGISVLFVWTPFFVIATKILVLCGLMLVLIFAIAASQALLRGYKPARYFTFAWAIFMAGVFVTGLTFAGIVPANFFTIYSMQITSTMEIVILTLALVDRYKVLHEAKATAEMQASSAIIKLNTKLENMVLERTRALKESNKKLQELASKDSLTGLLNHKTAIQEVEKALASVSRYNHTIAVVMLDVDHFKDFNDRYGHQVGDDILITIADILHQNLRSTDACGRYGGEEFILILTRTELDEVKTLGERIRTTICNATFERAPGAKITASLGIAMCYPTQYKNYSADTLITAADNALYEAKDKGRNTVCFAPQAHIVST